MATKKENLKGKKKEDLVKELSARREEMRVIAFKAEGSRSKNVKELSTLKKKIARILTEMNSKTNNKK